MANHQQAKKRNRQRLVRTTRNRHVRSTMRTSVKRVRKLIDQNEQTGAREALGIAVSQLDKAVTKGILHRRTASRAISRLNLAVNKIKNPQ